MSGHVINLKEFKGSHTADAVGKLIESELAKFDICFTRDIMSATQDTAGNSINALRGLPVLRLPCISHVLSSCAKHTLSCEHWDSYSGRFKKAKVGEINLSLSLRAIAFISVKAASTTKSLALLEEAIKKTDCPNKRPIIPCETRFFDSRFQVNRCV